MEFKKEYKEIYNSYNLKLKELQQMGLDEANFNLEYLITYLQYLRDYFILTEEVKIDNKENMKIATIATAVDEYYQYQNCIHKYYKIEKNNVSKKLDGTDEEVSKQYQDEKAKHWNIFWEIVKGNIEFWRADECYNLIK